MEAGGFAALNPNAIYDWPSFHRESQHALGFPPTYGRSMDAWVDCLISLRDADGRRVGMLLGEGEMLQLEIGEVEQVRERVPEFLETLVDAVAEVNRRFVEAGQAPAVALIFV